MTTTVLKSNTFESGSNGTAVTTSNSASPDAWSRLIIPGDVGSGNTFNYDSGWSLNGSLSAKMVQTGANKCLCYWTWTTAQTDIAFQTGFRTPGLPAVSGPIFRFFSDNAYTTPSIDLGFTTAGKIYIRDDIGAVQSSSSTGSLSINTDYVWVFRYVSGTATLSAYPKGSTTATASISLSIASISVNSFMWGIITASTGMTLQVDDMSVGYGGFLVRTDLSNSAPVVTAGPTQNLVSTATTATLTAAVTDDVAATTATWALRTSSGTSNPTVGSTSGSPSLPSASTTITASVTGLLPGQHIFDLTVGDGTLSTVGTTIVNITSTAPAYRSVTAASYSVVGGGTALAAIQAGTPLTRYLQSTAPPAGGTGSIAYQPLQAASVPTVFGVKLRASDAVTAVNVTVYLKMAGTTIATRGPFTLTTTEATYGGTTTSGEDATLTDKSQLTTDWTAT